VSGAPDANSELAALSQAADPGRGHRLAVTLLPALLVFLAVILLVFYVLFSSAMVDGDSMYPTLHDRDYLLVTRGDTDLKRGDLVSIIANEPSGPIDIVKRVIGLPGDIVEVRDDVAIVNGQPEPQRGQIIQPQFSVSVPPVTVPTGNIYVMGDNRAVSEDSRYVGPLAVSGLKGRAVAIFAPINRIRFLP